MLGAKKINKGYQESQLSKILNKSDSYSQLEIITKGDKNLMGKIISHYLKACEKAFDVSYQDPGKDIETKISGLRYIFYIMPCTLDIIRNRKSQATEKAFFDVLKQLPKATGIDDVFCDDDTALAFRSENATVKLAKKHAAQLTNYEATEASGFDMTKGI